MSTQSKCFKCGGKKSSARDKMQVIYFDHQPDECFQYAIDRIEALEAKMEILAVHQHHVRGNYTEGDAVVTV